MICRAAVIHCLSLGQSEIFQSHATASSMTNMGMHIALIAEMQNTPNKLFFTPLTAG